MHICGPSGFSDESAEMRTCEACLNNIQHRSALCRHVLVGLHWLQAVIRKWWLELSQNEKQLQGGCSEYRCDVTTR